MRSINYSKFIKMTMTTLNFIANGEKQPLFFDLYIGRISSLINSDKIDEFIRESNGCRKRLTPQTQRLQPQTQRLTPPIQRLTPQRKRLTPPTQRLKLTS